MVFWKSVSRFLPNPAAGHAGQPIWAQSGFWRPKIEVMENRDLLSTLTPRTFADGGLGSGSPRDAVLQFNADTGTEEDTIQLLPGTYSVTSRNAGNRHETAGLTGDLNLTQTSHRWIIHGAGPSTIIDASQLQDRVFDIVNPGIQVVFQDLVIQGGLAQDDGADGALAGTTDALGGGILNNGGDITLDNVILQNNVVRGGNAASFGVAGHNGFGGGIYSTGGALTMAGTTIANNQASGGRGGDINGFQDAGPVATPNWSRAILPELEIESKPKAAAVDRFFGSLREQAHVLKPAQWPDLEPIQSIGSDPDLLAEGTGLVV